MRIRGRVRHQVTESDVVGLTPGVTVVGDQGGVTAFHPGRGEYWRGNPTAARVLAQLQAGTRVDALVDVLQAGFAVDRDRLGRDVLALLDELSAAGLVRVDRR